MSINSEEIKLALLSNYRYKKQSIAADEVGFILGQTDISAYKKGTLTEIEIKISKSDMYQGEKAKFPKHEVYKNPEFGYGKWNTVYGKKAVPNYFFLCVPTALLEEAKGWVLSINEKYGILEYKTDRQAPAEDLIYVFKRAKLLHSEPHPKSLETIAKRLSSANIVLKNNLKYSQKSYNDIYQKYNELRGIK